MEAARKVEIVAPEGSNVVLRDGLVRWDKWSFHVRLEPRPGVVLSLIRYDDKAGPRDVAYQMSASEMFVPYMDASPTWAFRAYMDIGEYGFGMRLGAYGLVDNKRVEARKLDDPTAAADTASGTLVAPHLLAVNHDHYVAFRIDMDADGSENRLVEDRIVPRRISQDGPRRSLWQVETRPMGV